jgi:hypothetical protein
MRNHTLIGRNAVLRAALVAVIGSSIAILAHGPIQAAHQQTSPSESVERDLARLRLAGPDLHVRGVRGDAIQPAAERRLTLERVDLARRRPERVLRRLLRILVRPRDTHREPVDPVAERLHEELGGLRVVAPERLDERRVGVDLPRPRGRHAARSYSDR